MRAGQAAKGKCSRLLLLMLEAVVNRIAKTGAVTLVGLYFFRAGCQFIGAGLSARVQVCSAMPCLLLAED